MSETRGYGLSWGNKVIINAGQYDECWGVVCGSAETDEGPLVLVRLPGSWTMSVKLEAGGSLRSRIVAVPEDRCHVVHADAVASLPAGGEVTTALEFKPGDKLTVRPLSTRLQESLPASAWLTTEQDVEAIEEGANGGLDVYDVRLGDGSEESVYGVQIVQIIKASLPEAK